RVADRPASPSRKASDVPVAVARQQQGAVLSNKRLSATRRAADSGVARKATLGGRCVTHALHRTAPSTLLRAELLRALQRVAAESSGMLARLAAAVRQVPGETQGRAGAAWLPSAVESGVDERPDRE